MIEPKSEEKLEIIWVEIGRNLPKHLVNNVFLHKELYPSIPQVLITDSKNAQIVEKACNVVHISQLRGLAEEIERLKSDVNRTSKQVDFWVNTTSRFLAINFFLDKREDFYAIHLESDCVLLSIEGLKQRFKEPWWGMAYPLQAKGIGCASIMLLKKVDTLSRFAKEIRKDWNLLDQDDMKILGDFSHDNEVMLLPTSLSENEFYDAQTIGRYFLGTDARNMRWPFSARGIVDGREGAVNPNNIEFRYLEEDGFPRIKLLKGDSESILANIHIHSKRVPRTKSTLKKLLAFEAGRHEGIWWRIGRFDSQVFLERLISWIHRKLLRRETEFRLR